MKKLKYIKLFENFKDDTDLLIDVIIDIKEAFLNSHSGMVFSIDKRDDNHTYYSIYNGDDEISDIIGNKCLIMLNDNNIKEFVHKINNDFEKYQNGESSKLLLFLCDLNKNYLNESEISEHSNKVGDMEIIEKQLIDFIKPGDKKSGYDAKIIKKDKQLTVTNDEGNYVIIKDNGLPNDFYTVQTKDNSGISNEGNENSAENVLTFVAHVFNKSNGIGYQDKTTKNGNINNKY